MCNRSPLMETLFAKAKARTPPKRVALPECEAVNTLRAARRLLDEGIAVPVLVNSRPCIAQTAARAGVSVTDIETIDMDDAALAARLLERYMNRRRPDVSHGLKLSADEYRQHLSDPLYYAMMTEAVGDTDCAFCGHTNTTAAVLRAALDVIGLEKRVDIASIMALVEVPGFSGPEGDTIAFADCGLNPEPSPAELASIAISACDSVRAILGWEARAAFLSFSTSGSGRSAGVEKIGAALDIARERRPDLALDGEFQLDAAIDPDIAAVKVKRPSAVAGRANVLIFPDLASANIAIKIVQRFAGGRCFGHNFSGFCLPVADSSRAATVEEMLGDIAMLVLSAMNY